MTDQPRLERTSRRKPRTSDVIRPLLVLTAIAIFCQGWPVTAESTGYRLVGSLLFKASSATTAWYVSAYQADVADLAASDLPAKLCFSRRAIDPRPSCVAAESHQNAIRYAFQTVEALSVERILDDGESAVLFVARFSGGGSGALRLISLWGGIGAQTGLRRILFQVVSEQSEYMALPLMKNGHRGVFVTADYQLSSGETHFSLHHFIVRIFKLNVDRSAFTNVDTYTTARKYPSLDDADRIEIIRYELPQIDKRLDRTKK